MAIDILSFKVHIVIIEIMQANGATQMFKTNSKLDRPVKINATERKILYYLKNINDHCEARIVDMRLDLTKYPKIDREKFDKSLNHLIDIRFVEIAAYQYAYLTRSAHSWMYEAEQSSIKE
jgi:hypothetical protein